MAYAESFRVVTLLDDEAWARYSHEHEESVQRLGQTTTPPG